MALDTSQKQTIIEAFKVHEKDTGIARSSDSPFDGTHQDAHRAFQEVRERPQLAEGSAGSCRNEEKTPELPERNQRRKVQKVIERLGLRK